MIPWVLADSNYSVCPPQRLVPSRTVFVGGLHGMLNAQALALIMNDLFGGVIYVGIDTDRHKYPIGRSAALRLWIGTTLHISHPSLLTGSGRVSFGTQSSYLKSLHAAFVEIKTPKFTKKVQTHTLKYQYTIPFRNEQVIVELVTWQITTNELHQYQYLAEVAE